MQARRSEASQQAGQLRLFGAPAIAVHTLLFTPLVGAAMAAINWRRVGDRHRERMRWVGGAAATLVIVGVNVLGPESMETLVRGATIGATIAVAFTLHREQTVLLERERARTTVEIASFWPATILGALFVLIVVAAGGGDPRFDRGARAFERGDYLEAQSAFEEILREHPEADDARYHLALVRLRLGDVPGARRELRRVRDSAEVAPEARRVLRDIEASSGE